ncbi:hypothetical protein [Streptomyces sp. NPDC059009]|uniref:hypothetical protein n=1 Tax=Streptomyces sp. NPDC059009 TaxID=3346694 RepID=UPI0036D16AED
MTAEQDKLAHGQAAEHITAVVLRALRQFWTGRHALLLLDEFDRRATAFVDELRACGARIGAVVARTGPAPGAAQIERSWHCSDAGRHFTAPEFEAWLHRPSADVAAWLDDLDPGRQWVVLGTPRTGVEEFCGRAVHGWRRPQWAAVEDKTTIDRLWAEAGVAAPPHRVVGADELLRGPADLAELSGSAGVVVAADATRGHVGDARGLRWVPDLDRFPAVARDLAGRTDRARIARFADGVPCSVLGLALPDGVAVFSPIEIVTLGAPASGRLLFCGSSTHWRPGEEAEHDIRDAARRAGTQLARSIGYRGLFSVDGLLTPDGFRATELNPRHASGLGLRAALPDFPLYLYNRAVQEDLPGLDDLTSAALERTVRRAVAAAPSYSLAVPVRRAARVFGSTGRRSLAAGGSLIDYRLRHGAASLTAITPAAPHHRAGPACAALAAHLGAPDLTSFPLNPPPHPDK